VVVKANPNEMNHAVLSGSAANDAADCNGLTVTMKSADKKWNAELDGFTRVTLDGDAGAGADQLVLHDSIKNDELDYHPNSGVLLRGDGIQYTFHGFEANYFSGNSGKKYDTDIVRIYDTPGNETFRAISNWGIYVDDKNAWSLKVFNIDKVYLDGSAGGV